MKSFLPGLRIIKTFIAVSICLFGFYLFNYDKPIYAAIACILMMKESSDETKSMGINRVIGTLLGGATSMFFVIFIDVFSLNHIQPIVPIVASLSVLLNLTICKGFELDSYVSSMSCVVSVIILLSVGLDFKDAYKYVIIRTIETMIGILIAFFVNKFLFKNHDIQ